MLNVVVAGKVKDEDGYSVDCNYTVEYKNRHIISGSEETDDHTVYYNIGDPTHLGEHGTLRNGDVMYVNMKQYSNNNIIRSSRKRLIYSNGPVFLFDAVLTNVTNDTNIDLKKIYNSKFEINNNSNSFKKMYIDILINSSDISIYDTNKLISVQSFDVDNKHIVVEFLSSGKYKIMIDTIFENDNCITDEFDIDAVADCVETSKTYMDVKQTNKIFVNVGSIVNGNIENVNTNCKIEQNIVSCNIEKNDVKCNIEQNIV